MNIHKKLLSRCHIYTHTYCTHHCDITFIMLCFEQLKLLQGRTRMLVSHTLTRNSIHHIWWDTTYSSPQPLCFCVSLLALSDSSLTLGASGLNIALHTYETHGPSASAYIHDRYSAVITITKGT